MYWSYLKFATSILWDTSQHMHQDALIIWDQNPNVWPTCKTIFVVEKWADHTSLNTHLRGETWWLQHYVGCFSLSGTEKLVRVADNKDGSKDVAKYLEMPEAFKSDT